MEKSFVLACPICKTKLVRPYVTPYFLDDDELPVFLESTWSHRASLESMVSQCPSCTRGYGIYGGIIDLFPLELQDTPYLIESYRYDEVVNKGQEKYSGLDETYPDKRAAFIRETLEAHGMTGYVNIGPGFGFLENVTQGMDRLAIDLCWGFLRYLQVVHPKVVCVRGVAEHLPLLTGSVKCLVADSTFQSVINRERFLYEIARVTTLGSLLILSIAYKWNYPRRPQNGFNINQPDEYKVLKRFIYELGFDAKFKFQEVGTGKWAKYSWGDYLWIIGRKKR